MKFLLARARQRGIILPPTPWSCPAPTQCRNRRRTLAFSQLNANDRIRIANL